MNKMVFENIVKNVLMGLVPKIVEEGYDYAKEQISSLMEDDPKPEPVKKKRTVVQDRTNKFTKADVEWIKNNFEYYMETGKTYNGAVIDKKDKDPKKFYAHCRETFNNSKSDMRYSQIARKGLKAFTRPDLLEDGEERKYITPSKLGK